MGKNKWRFKVKESFKMDFLLQHLRDLQQKLGRTPTTSDIDTAHREGLRAGKRLPSHHVYNQRFDGLSEALGIAGGMDLANCKRSSLELAQTPGGIRKELLKFFADCDSRGEEVTPTSLGHAIHSAKLRISPTAFNDHYRNPGNALLVLGRGKVRRSSIANGPPLTSPRARR